MKNNPYFGWILKDNPTFWEDNGFEKCNTTNYHYFGCKIAAANNRPLYKKQLYIDHDYEEEAAVEVFCCELGSVADNYIVAIYDWNNAGYTGFALKEVRQISTINEFNALIQEWGLDDVEDGTFLLKKSNSSVIQN